MRQSYTYLYGVSKLGDLLRKTGRILLKVFLWFFLVSFVLVLLYKWVPVPFTPHMVIRYTQNLLNGKEARIIKEWKSLDEMSPHIHLAVVASEDQNFLKHSGIDWGAIEKAMEENKKRKNPRGASTITQQTVKNVFLWHGRNYFRKGLEVYFTWLVELIWGKKRILEVYLNIIETGDGMYGIAAVSKHCFNKSPDKLTPAEAARIAAILPGPRKYSCKNPSAFILKRQAEVNYQMRMFGGKLRWQKQ